ncbi:NRR repressor like [Senna tora]|uniref:NRR repressor like n=1 Tax=Senna tora TaxID=362788 RepID=A0A834SUC6_9FABA|nr:NRR repressor like [Senna tora]
MWRRIVRHVFGEETSVVESLDDDGDEDRFQEIQIFRFYRFPGHMSDGEKRKHSGDGDGNDGAVSASQKKARDEVTDDEVEEFYAILRRINAAAKYFKTGNDRPEGTAARRRWRAPLEKEIMQQVDGVKEETSTQEILDLNLSPKPE